VKEESSRALVVLVTNAPALHAYAVRQMYAALQDHADAEFSLLMVATWIVGGWPRGLVHHWDEDPVLGCRA
jgi:hypothetical protein